MQLPQRRQRRLRQRRQNYPGSLLLLPRSRKKRQAARTGPIEAGTVLFRGADRMLITRAGAATATNDQVQAGEHAPPARRRLTHSPFAVSLHGCGSPFRNPNENPRPKGTKGAGSRQTPRLDSGRTQKEGSAGLVTQPGSDNGTEPSM